MKSSVPTRGSWNGFKTYFFGGISQCCPLFPATMGLNIPKEGVEPHSSRRLPWAPVCRGEVYSIQSRFTIYRSIDSFMACNILRP
ncbi:unnamed protein product [Nezara viridula]|uniref:Uncharacterized protein n=1 Tax=Nezara viridula TaxID=85310 RepID=A0A9P0MTA3_NEZVI|nr:unnamed protein product [Nezara viridula]